MEILYNATIKQSFFDVDGKHDYYTMRVVTSLEPGGHIYGGKDGKFVQDAKRRRN